MRRTRSARNKLEENKELGESEPTTCVWQWEVGDGEWEAFPPAECSQLDAAFQAGRASVSLTLSNGSKYKVDLKKMIQTNTTTKFQRQIRSHALKQESAGEAGGLANQNAGPAPIKEEEEPEEEPVAKKSRGTDITTEDSDSKEVVKTMVMKGKAPVDSECTAKLGKPPAPGARRPANVTAAHLPGRRERFSGEETDLLAREVRSRESLIYGGGGFPPRQPDVRRAWEEIAASVSSFSGVRRTAAACRKRYNDVRRRGKQRLAAHRRQLAAGAPSATGSDEDAAVSALCPDGVQGFGGIEVGLPGNATRLS
ncbi:hypothetical protein COCON_G00137540 [Conger conger]|uniref:WWE domain-containing protein n=1 Tax=Conger conger TaxID=82655 RepID=A0A9Q1DF16_CONCO|nr:hypothetical protein COCON_G00137540 [Conger conger]